MRTKQSLLLGMSLIFLMSIPLQAQTIKLKSSEGYVLTEDAVRLFYKIQGEGKDTIVVVHGGTYNSGYLSPDLTPLAAHHTMLYYDQRATGYSTFLNDTSKLGIQNHVGDLETIRKYFNLKKLNLLGHSTGGAIAGFYAAAYPKQINSMILVNSLPAKAGWKISFGSKMDSLSNLLEKQNNKRLYSAPMDTIKACWDYYAIHARGFFPNPVMVRRFWGDVCNCNPKNIVNPAKSHIYRSMGNYDLSKQMKNVKAPVLIIAGEDDGIPLESFEQWRNSFTNSTLIKVPNSAHFPHVDAPNAFFTAVEDFMLNKTPDQSIFQVTGAGIILPGDDKGTPYQQARASVIRVEDELVKHINKEDWEGAAAIYATDAKILAPGAPPLSGRQAIASFWHTAAIRGMRSLELQLMDLEISGELLTGYGKYTMSDQQGEIIDVGKFIAIYRREKNRWVLQTDIFNTSMETRSPIEVPDYLKLQN